MRLLLFAIFILGNFISNAQNISGTIYNAKTNNPIAYVNIGISGKNIGTVSDFEGKFNFQVAFEFDGDSLLFSCIGFEPRIIKVRELRNNNLQLIVLQEKVQDLKEVVIRPRVYKEKMLGIVTDTKFISAGFENNELGYEMGIFMDVKKSAVLKRVDLNIARCSYDTVFYRLNIYSHKGDMVFDNILKSPIYINLPKDRVRDKITIDLQRYDLVVEGNFLVTVELVKDLGPGFLYFSAGLKDRTYFRKTSQGVWDTAPVGISISVLADVEK